MRRKIYLVISKEKIHHRFMNYATSLYFNTIKRIYLWEEKTDYLRHRCATVESSSTFRSLIKKKK